ncbi:alpha/beta fold hydrolase [Streptomyces sp. NPDC005859]|uniref:alpha/beta fold hydrolase n=1 Tax=Streptomyces sp. NPDC005859 TaxID=3157170 RepID=UPI0033DCBB8F
MPALARAHTVVAVGSRGAGLSDKPDDGYDAGTPAADPVTLMAALGHDRFDAVGYDIGMWTGYALAADHPERVGRLTVVDAIIPGLTPAPSVFSPVAVNQRLWHFGFNRLTDLNEELVRGRKQLFFGYQFAKKAATPDAVPAYAVDVYPAAMIAALLCADVAHRPKPRNPTQRCGRPGGNHRRRQGVTRISHHRHCRPARDGGLRSGHRGKTKELVTSSCGPRERPNPRPRPQLGSGRHLTSRSWHQRTSRASVCSGARTARAYQEVTVQWARTTNTNE